MTALDRDSEGNAMQDRPLVSATCSESDHEHSEAERVAVAACGDMNHLIQPIIGSLRMHVHRGEQPDADQMDYWIRRLYAALDVANHFGDTEARAAMAAKYHEFGLGLPSTPEGNARFIAILRGEQS